MEGEIRPPSTAAGPVAEMSIVPRGPFPAARPLSGCGPGLRPPGRQAGATALCVQVCTVLLRAEVPGLRRAGVGVSLWRGTESQLELAK